MDQHDLVTTFQETAQETREIKELRLPIWTEPLEAQLNGMIRLIALRYQESRYQRGRSLPQLAILMRRTPSTPNSSESQNKSILASLLLRL